MDESVVVSNLCISIRDASRGMSAKPMQNQARRRVDSRPQYQVSRAEYIFSSTQFIEHTAEGSESENCSHYTLLGALL